ncbi:MAG TPA: CBS domain-containing protein [Planctomycetota bacterium]
MNVRELMQKPAATVRTSDSLARAVNIMRHRACGSVVVVGPDGRAVAMMTDRDICLAAQRLSRALAELKVHQAMSQRLFTCGPDDDVARVEDLMSLHQVRRLPVVDLDGRPLGVVSLDDLAKAARRQADLIASPVPSAGVGRVLGDICRPHFVSMESQDRAVALEGG